MENKYKKHDRIWERSTCMSQEEIAKWLKVITGGIGMMGVVFFFLFVPMLAGEMKDGYPEAACLYWPGLIYNFVIASVCYAILFCFWTVCCQIGRDNSFSKENAMAFKRISRLAVLFAAIWFAGFACLVALRCLHPAMLLFLIFAMFISFAVAICAAALSHLVLKAYELRQENELTI